MNTSQTPYGNYMFISVNICQEIQTDCLDSESKMTIGHNVLSVSRKVTAFAT